MLEMDDLDGEHDDIVALINLKLKDLDHLHTVADHINTAVDAGS